MTELTITPKFSDKTARFKGTIAAGEHVAVTIRGGAEWIADGADENLTLRVIDLTTKRTLAVFPRPEETLEEGETADAWDSSGEDLTCTLDLNTLRMVNAARHMLRVPVMFVLGDTDSPRTLYFCDRYTVEYWPERIGDDVPYDLDKWPKKIDEWTALVSEWTEQMEAWSTALAGKQDTISDLGTIRAGAAKGATAIQSHQDISGKADLVGGKVPQSQLPSYVDDVLEYAAAANFPATGEEGKIYVAKDENKTYRWSGTGYVQIGGSDITIDSALSDTSENPVQNKVVTEAVDARPTKEQIDAGWWSEWTIDGYEPDDKELHVVWVDATDYLPAGWVIYGNIAGCLPKGDRDSETVTWTTQDGDLDRDYTAVRHRVASPVPTKTSDLTNDSGFLTQHQRLTPVYSQTPTFSEWVTEPAGYAESILFEDGLWCIPGNENANLPNAADINATSLVFDSTDKFTATRTRTDVIGYTLGTQTTKPLQPQGEYAPATNIPKSALASGVQTSLGKADTAVQPAGIAGLMPMYAIDASPTTLTTWVVPESWFPIVWTDKTSDDTVVTHTISDALGVVFDDDGSQIAMKDATTGNNSLIFFDSSTGEYYGAGYFQSLTIGDPPSSQINSLSLDAKNILTVSPYTVSTYTSGSTAAAFEIAVGALPTGVTGKARDCILVIDCTATDAVAPTVTWDTHFHPRTDTETDLAIVEAGKRAVFYISEYMAGEFAVGGWVETDGGSGT